jgi:hypothetical protein
VLGPLQALLADAAEPVEPVAVPEPVAVVSKPVAVAKGPVPTASSTRRGRTAMTAVPARPVGRKARLRCVPRCGRQCSG